MKYTIILLLLIIFSCNSLTKNDVFDSDKLKGKYKVDLTPFVEDAVKAEEGDDEWDELGKGLAGLALSSVEIKLSFYEDNKGVMEMSGGLIDFANTFSDEPVEKIQEFTYKVENDSILYMKENGESEYEKWAIVRTFSENYDYLQFLIIEEGEDKVYLNLSKITE